MPPMINEILDIFVLFYFIHRVGIFFFFSFFLFFFLEGTYQNLLRKTNNVILDNRTYGWWDILYPYQKNLRYKEHVLLTYTQPYYPFSLHESKVID